LWKLQTACVIMNILTWNRTFSVVPKVCSNSRGRRKIYYERTIRTV
jgi:hypothetical protein